MGESTTPLVSLGLPVFNGENFLVDALESVRAQTLTDYELIICDNASTDATEKICRRYQAQDSRIRYFRNQENLGSAPNCNLAFKYSTGRYFKWACHDDTFVPEYLEKMVASLEANRDAVLCHSLVQLIDADGVLLDIHDSGLAAVASPSPSARFATMILVPHQCLELDGVMRRSLLADSSLVPSFPGGDRALLSELALLGRILQIEESIFMTREHPDRFRRIATTPEERLAFYDTSRGGQKSVSTGELYSHYWRSVRRHVGDRGERYRCYWHLLRWWFVNWNAARLMVDILALFSPGILTRAEHFKQKLFSPEPGPNSSRDKRVESSLSENERLS